MVTITQEELDDALAVLKESDAKSDGTLAERIADLQLRLEACQDNLSYELTGVGVEFGR